MRFAIQENKPYLISGGKAYPVELTEHHGVNISIEDGQDTELTGHLTYWEIAAKFGKPGAEIVPQETELLGVHAFDLISPGTRVDRDGFVEGTLYRAKIEQFSSDKAEQTGYYFPVRLMKQGEVLTTVKNGKTRTQPFPDDSLLLIRVPDQDTRVRILADGVEIAYLNFSRASFSARSYVQPVGVNAVKIADQDAFMDSVDKASMLIGGDVRIAWNGTEGEVSGSVHWYEFTNGHFESAPTGHYVPVIVRGYDNRPITVSGSTGAEVTLTDPKWIIRVDDFITGGKKAVLKCEGTTLAELDFKGVTLEPPMGELAFEPFGEKADFGRYGKYEEYVESLNVTWDGTGGTASGRLKAYDGTDGRNELNKGKGHFLPVVLNHYYTGKSVSVYCKNEKTEEATDWIIAVTDAGIPLTVKYDGRVVATIDLSGLELAAAPVRSGAKRAVKKPKKE